MDEHNTVGSAPAGSPNDPASFNQNAAGQSQETDYEKAYKELESRLGAQGQELGEYREFFKNIGPLLDKLDEMPELVQAIEQGKIDKSLAEAVLSGRVSVQGAEALTQAHEEVKTSLGKKFEKTPVEDINKLVDEKVGKIRQELAEKEELNAFEAYTRDFIANTPDFADYADAIDTWLDAHKDVNDIEVAYYAIKGKLSEANAKKAAERETTERAKDIALNASGGATRSSGSVGGVSLADQLISGRPNPNSFFPGA